MIYKTLSVMLFKERSSTLFKKIEEGGFCVMRMLHANKFGIGMILNKMHIKIPNHLHEGSKNESVS